MVVRAEAIRFALEASNEGSGKKCIENNFHQHIQVF